MVVQYDYYGMICESVLMSTALTVMTGASAPDVNHVRYYKYLKFVLNVLCLVKGYTFTKYIAHLNKIFSTGIL